MRFFSNNFRTRIYNFVDKKIKFKNKIKFKKKFKIIRKCRLKKIFHNRHIKQKILNEKLRTRFIQKMSITASYLSKDKMWPWPFVVEQIEDYILTQTNDALEKVINDEIIRKELMSQFWLMKRSKYYYKDELTGRSVFIPIEYVLMTQVKYLTILIKELYPPPYRRRMWRGRRLVLLTLLLKLSDYDAWLRPLSRIFWTLLDYRIYLFYIEEFGLLKSPLTSLSSFLFWTYIWVYVYTPLENNWIIFRIQKRYTTDYYYYTRWKLMEYSLWYNFLLNTSDPRYRDKYSKYNNKYRKYDRYGRYRK